MRGGRSPPRHESELSGKKYGRLIPAAGGYRDNGLGCSHPRHPRDSVLILSPPPSRYSSKFPALKHSSETDFFSVFRASPTCAISTVPGWYHRLGRLSRPTSSLVTLHQCASGTLVQHPTLEDTINWHLDIAQSMGILIGGRLLCGQRSLKHLKTWQVLFPLIVVCRVFQMNS